MKTILLFTLILTSVLRGEELVPELALLARTRETALTALDEQKAAAIAATRPPYLAALDAADQAAMKVGKVQIVKAIAHERECVEKGGMGATLPTDLPKNLEPPRRAFLKAVERVETDFGQKRKTLDAAYLRDLSGLQFKAASNPTLAAQIVAEKQKLVAGAYGPITDLAVGLPNTRWKQVGQDTVLTFKDGIINGAWRYETPAKDKLVIHWNGNSSATLTLGHDGKTFVEGGKVTWELLTPETHFQQPTAAAQPATRTAPANLFGDAAPSAIPNTKEDLEKALVGTSWTWEDDNGRLAFAYGGKAETDGHSHKWQVTGRRSLTVDGIGFTFDETLSTYKCPGWPNGARSGKRIK